MREWGIPKRSGKPRYLGIPAVLDRVVQAALKLVIEPIFEADFQPCSYGFRPKRRAQDAIAEIHLLASPPRSYERVVEGDIEACFDEIDHRALMHRVEDRIGGKRVLALIKAFLKAGVLSEDGVERDTITGTPQGGVLSPLLANIALSVLDDHFVEAWVDGRLDRTLQAAQEGSGHLSDRPLCGRFCRDGVRHSSARQGGAQRGSSSARADGFAPVRKQRRGSPTSTRASTSWGSASSRSPSEARASLPSTPTPSKAALAAVKGKVRSITQGGTNQSLEVLLHRINPVLRGWANYFRHGVSKATFDYVRAFTWRRIVRWLRRKNPRANWKQLRRRYLPGWWPTEGGVVLFDIGKVAVTRYRYRGSSIPSPWPGDATGTIE